MEWIIIGVIVVTVAIYAMINVSVSYMSKGQKMFWFAIVALIPLVGPLLYYVVRPNQ